MFFKTLAESQELARQIGHDTPYLNRLRSLTPPPGVQRFAFDHAIDRSYPLARGLLRLVGHFDVAILLITEYGVWQNLENTHLYYRLRTAYHDHRMINEAPGHIFLGHESAELASFLDLAFRFCWGGFLLLNSPSSSIFFSHDGWLHIDGIATPNDELTSLETSQLLAPIHE